MVLKLFQLLSLLSVYSVGFAIPSSQCPILGSMWSVFFLILFKENPPRRRTGSLQEPRWSASWKCVSGEARPFFSPGLQHYLPVWLPLASGGEGGVLGEGEVQ